MTFDELQAMIERLTNSYSARFLHAAQITLELEGADSDDPSDLGGPTRFGMSAANNPDIAEDIASGLLTRDSALERYHQRYWKPLPLIDRVPGPIAFVLFDARVHGNLRSFTRRLQLFINANGIGDLQVDGWYGAQTAKAATLMTECQVSCFLEYLKSEVDYLATTIAKSVQAKQRRQGRPVRDYTRGFKRRFNLRADRAEEVA